MVGWILFAVAVLLVVVYYVRHPLPKLDKNKGDAGNRGRAKGIDPQAWGPWHAVAVMSKDAEQPCDATVDLRGKRFLASEAPTIPLPNCDVGSCHCWYAHYDDRRQGDRRAGHNIHDGVMSGLGVKDDRRVGRDRRKTAPINHAIPT
jgi:hypothetical protein